MQEVFAFFNQGWVGSLIGLVGLIVGGAGIFSYKIARSTAQPAYQQSYLKLLGGEENNLPSEVEVFYKNSKVSRLTKNRVIFWNNGTEVLDRSAIVSGDPISISYSKKTNILSFKVLRVTRDVVNFDVHRPAEDAASLLIDFDYLDPKDGAIIEILHDGSDRYPQIRGTLKGIPKGISNLGQMDENPPYVIGPVKKIIRSPDLFYVAAIACGAVLIFYGIFPDESLWWGTKPDVPYAPGVLSPRLLAGIGVVYASIPATYLWLKRRKYPKSLRVE